MNAAWSLTSASRDSRALASAAARRADGFERRVDVVLAVSGTVDDGRAPARARVVVRVRAARHGVGSPMLNHCWVRVPVQSHVRL